MALTTAGKNIVANASATEFNRIMLYNATGNPATGEKTITWGTASNGVITLSGVPIEFTISAGVTIGAIAILKDVSGSLTEIEVFDIVDESYPDGGFFTIDSGTYTFA